MGFSETHWSDPVTYLRTERPDDPVLFLAPPVQHP